MEHTKLEKCLQICVYHVLQVTIVLSVLLSLLLPVTTPHKWESDYLMDFKNALQDSTVQEQEMQFTRDAPALLDTSVLQEPLSTS
jgi:hypothetical protein